MKTNTTTQITSSTITSRLNTKFKVIIFTLASIIFGISGAFAQVEPSVDVKVAIQSIEGFADSSVNHNICFKNTSLTSDDRINISSVSSQGWVVALFDETSSNLIAIDADGDGSWDYVSLPYDTDHNGEPETKNLTPGTEQCLNFMMFIPEEATEGTIDTLSVTGFSVIDRNVSDIEKAFTQISDFAVLPIELLSFNATLTGTFVTLNWATATEINNEYFSIERSADGKIYNEVMVMKGAGNTNSITNYTIEDREPVSGTSYYRLKQTDYDGQSETFKAVIIRNNKSVQTISIEQNAYPNPFTSNFTIGFNVEEKGTVIAVITDIQGRNISNETMTAAKGHNQFSFENGSSLPKGMYFISLECNGNVTNSKILKSSDF